MKNLSKKIALPTGLRHFIAALIALLSLSLSAQAQTDYVFSPAGGGGGSNFHARCADGQILTGLELRVGNDVDAIRPICSKIYGPTEAGGYEPYPLKFGGDGGHTIRLNCPSKEPVVTSIRVLSEGSANVINNIHLYCNPLGQKNKEVPSAKFDGPKYKPDFLESVPYGEDATQRCPGSLVGVGINGRSGQRLDALGLVCGEAKILHKPIRAVPRVQSQFIGTFSTTPANYQPLWVYTIKDDGDLMWYRKDTGASPWQGPNKVGNGWDFKDVIPAGGNSFYALTDDGKLFWYQHTGFNDGTRTWKPRVEVGHGWSFATIFSGGEGIIYAITDDGRLLWYKHNGYLTGAGLDTPRAWENSKEVGRGWNGFEQVFSNGAGIIYVITKDGKLRWYKHNGYLTGAGLATPGAWDGPKEVGRGWNGFRQVVPAGNGVILVIQNDGKLRWYKHNGYLTGAGLDTPGAWDGPREVGTGWQGFKKVFALLPVSSAPVVR